MAADCDTHLTFWNIGAQQVSVDFQGGRSVSAAGLLALRQLDKPLGVVAGLAQRLPDPRAQQFVTPTRERLLVQQVYQILAGYQDGHDAQDLRHDPLFQIRADLAPDDDQPLASGSTRARFQQAFTRRQADWPPAQRTVLGEIDAALSQRLRSGNDYLVERFGRTRRRRPASVILDLDAWDDPTHGHQVLTAFHGYFDQYQ
jgi:hypothetical protein